MPPSNETQEIVIGDTKYLYVGIIKLKKEYGPKEDEYNVILLDTENQVGIIGLSRDGEISLPAKKNRIVHKIPLEFQNHLKNLTRGFCSIYLTEKGKELLRAS